MSRGLAQCRKCGGPVSANARACPRCGNPAVPRTHSPLAVIAAVVGGLVLAGFGGRLLIASPAPVAVTFDPQVRTTPVFVQQAGPTLADRAKAKAQYDVDVAMLRKAKPRTEEATTKLIGRKPDSVMTAGEYTHIHWYYATKEEGRDVIAIATTADGKVVVSDF